MDWDKAIERNREALVRIVSALFGMIAAARISGGTGLMLPRSVWLAVLFVLRPAEAAVRRLIVIAARGLCAATIRPRRAGFARITPAAVPREPAFGLIDPLRDFSSRSDGSVEWVDDAGDDVLDFAHLPDSHPGEALNAAVLHVRLRALRHALADLSKQARRLALWQARRDLALKAGQPARVSAMRPGLPPGWRERPAHEIDPVLRECHRLARDLLNAPDTS
jgi:hypothetical protein